MIYPGDVTPQLSRASPTSREHLIVAWPKRSGVSQPVSLWRETRQRKWLDVRPSSTSLRSHVPLHNPRSSPTAVFAPPLPSRHFPAHVGDSGSEGGRWALTINVAGVNERRPRPAPSIDRAPGDDRTGADRALAARAQSRMWCSARVTPRSVRVSSVILMFCDRVNCLESRS